LGDHAPCGYNQKGINATLDLLGENTMTLDNAHQTAQDIIGILEMIDKTKVRANVSVKLTQLGLILNRQICVQNLTKILECASQLHNFVRIDMEDSTVTQKTLDVLNEVRGRGFENIGIVIQSYLYRSEEDISRLVDRAIPVRLCKGAYKEPRSVAYPHKGDVDAAYDRLATMLLKGALERGSPPLSDDGKKPPIPALATHDARRIDFAQETSTRIGLPKKSLEFQMLYGIRRDLQERLVQEGYPVRVYVPYGTEWYPYYMRRLGERPANVRFIVSNFFRN
jgi:proline dehydrogenase